mmetsp:Transcript_30723/g.30250  ORF Transcript_30723/g.30250 Transcript_30723/m.30250 type:complete len:185 (+) Transcript_30723:202-756(+)|eukprot:CAMPEP_0197005972 /NCGR_PEP_ID=MMETSP1380-20130617/32392_1 /TAXON_ID=5936 /ORGANISM="Euplotes crassus, Strain CT5" /LENGTH=184 /DNA_ID=CAMNT_0042425353 /DNA_START=202 /DNA_END=756 /DNA_ORIENTATION=-
MQSESGDDDDDSKVTAAVHDRMLAFTFTQGKFWVFNGKETEEDLSWETLKDRAWVVMNKIYKNKQNCIVKNNKYKIHDGDVLRFGKILFKVTLIAPPKKGKKKKLACENKYELIEKHSRPIRKLEDFASTKTVFDHGTDTLKNKLVTRIGDKGISSKKLIEGTKEATPPKKPEIFEETACRICY